MTPSDLVPPRLTQPTHPGPPRGKLDRCCFSGRDFPGGSRSLGHCRWSSLWSLPTLPLPLSSAHDWGFLCHPEVGTLSFPDNNAGCCFWANGTNDRREPNAICKLETSAARQGALQGGKVSCWLGRATRSCPRSAEAGTAPETFRSFWEKESQFSLRPRPLEGHHTPVDRPIPMNIRIAQTRLNGL